MTPGESRPQTSDCCGDAAAYLLGALEPVEAERFRQHAEHCVVCRDELASLHHVVDALPLTVAQMRAPKALRRRLMGGVRSEAAATPQLARRRGARRGSVPRLAYAGSLAAVIALTVLGGVELAGGGSPTARTIQASVTGIPGSAYLRIAGGHADLVVNHLPPPPPGRIYEVWIKRGNRPPAPTRALFSVTASGAADIGVPGSVGGGSAILVTAEPDGGSLVPTRAPLIVARLA